MTWARSTHRPVWPPSRSRPSGRCWCPTPASLDRAVELVDGAERVTLLVGSGARDARAEVLALAERLSAPMVLTLKAKEGLEHDNEFQIGQSGLIGNPATKRAFDRADLLLMVGTDFPYPEWLPAGTTTVQLDSRAENIGRRTPVDLALVGDAAATLRAADAEAGRQARPRAPARTRAGRYDSWQERQRALVDPDHDESLVGRIRARFDNPDERIRPEALAAAVDEVAAADAIFTTDTGMSTVWLSRFVRMLPGRAMVGSFNLGSMANAMPHALGAQALDRERQVVAFCGDGGLTMLLGDLLTAVNYRLPVKFVVFDNGRLGMVKLEQEQGGLPEFGTELAQPGPRRRRELPWGCTGSGSRTRTTSRTPYAAAFATPGPVLLDVVTNPDEVSLPPHTTASRRLGLRHRQDEGGPGQSRRLAERGGGYSLALLGAPPADAGLEEAVDVAVEDGRGCCRPRTRSAGP